MAQIRIRTGLLNCHFFENYQIARRNFECGRPLFEGQRPPTEIPDPRGEFLILDFSDEPGSPT